MTERDQLLQHGAEIEMSERISDSVRTDTSGSLFCVTGLNTHTQQWEIVEMYPEELLLVMEKGKAWLDHWNQQLKENGERKIDHKFAVQLIEETSASYNKGENPK